MSQQRVKLPKKQHIASRFMAAFGVIGYLSVFLQWGWALILYSSLYMGLAFFQPVPQQKPATIEPTGDPSLALLLFGGVITLAAIAATIFVFIKIPASAEKAGARITQTTANTLVPLVAHHKKVSKKQRGILTARIIFIAKCVLILLPLVAVFPAQLIPEQALEPLLMLVPALLFAVISSLCFALQYAIAWAAKIEPKTIR